MDKLTLFLVGMLILQCFLHWCSPVNYRKLESFKRWNTDYRFLKAEWIQGKEAYNLSFTGHEIEETTTFIFKHTYRKKNPFKIHLAENESYFLAVDNNSLVVKKSEPNTTEDQTSKGNYFNQIRVSEVFTRNPEHGDILQVIESQASLGSHIKSDMSGLVSLGGKDDCGCWIRIIATTRSGK